MSGNGGEFHPQRPERMMDIISPDECFTCGLKTGEWILKNPERKWIRMDMGPGMALFICPKCCAVRGNPNIHANNNKMIQWQKEDQEQRIKVASTIIDPRTNKVVDLKRVG